jgi:uncharacterized protein
MRLHSGEGRRLVLDVAIAPITLAAERYVVRPALIPVSLETSRTTGAGYAMRLRFAATLEGPCMRCLESAAPLLAVDAREVSMPGETDELDSPYVESEVLALGEWAREALVLVLPAKVLCREDCAGLCAICGINLNTVGAEHRHDGEPDPRWAKLAELHFES